MQCEGVIDLFQTIRILRTQRPAMVQTEVSQQSYSLNEYIRDKTIYIIILVNIKNRITINLITIFFFFFFVGTVPVLLSSSTRIPGIVRSVLRLRQARRVHVH